ISSLLYADDVVMFASKTDIVRLLCIAENHSKEFGYQWHPNKCAIIDLVITTMTSIDDGNVGMQNVPTYWLYTKTIPMVKTFKYLGIPFNQFGIDSDLFINQRITKATRSIALLRQLGIQQYGVGLWPALRAYRTFVHPVMEYGIAISTLSQVQIDKLDKAQKGCIKMTLNHNAKIQFPTIVPVVMANILLMKIRTYTLQFKFVTQLQNLPVSTLVKSIELSFLWNKNPDEHWKKLSTRNQFYQLYNKLKKSPKPPNDLISATIQ
ncbi:hypothetical protein BDA99DRAFT_447472, partial [Phascolomyces articulosus]